MFVDCEMWGVEGTKVEANFVSEWQTEMCTPLEKRGCNGQHEHYNLATLLQKTSLIEGITPLSHSGVRNDRSRLSLRSDQT
jgi:hypothetical protein